MGGTEPAQPTPTPTIPTATFTVPSPTTTYNTATPTSSDRLISATTNGGRVRQLAMDGAKFFVSKFAGAAASALATKAIDRAVPTQGMDGTEFLSPRAAQHMPTDWPKGLYGHPWRDKQPPYFTKVAGSDVPEGSAFQGIELARDTWSYISPYTGNKLVDNFGLREVGNFLQKYQRETVGGIIPLFAWGVRENKVNFLGGGSKPYKFAKWFFFKEVYDDWMATHGYDRYQLDLDGPPAPGWPGVVRGGDPWKEEPEKIPGMKNWSTGNEAIAHFEFEEDISGERPQTLRYPKFQVVGGETKKIEYPGNDITGRDEIPVDYPKPSTATDVPNDGEVLAADDDYYDPTHPTTSQYDEAMAAGGQTDIPVLPSNPPADGDTDMTPVPAGDDPDLFFKLFDKFNMNAGYASYRKNGVDIVADGQGYPVYDLDEAYRVALRTDNVQGFAYENSGSTKWWFGNNWNPGQLGVSNFPEYNNYFSYYSRWVVPAAEYMRVGIVFTTEVPGLNGFMGHISETGYEMNDRADTVEFETFEGGVNLDDFDEKTDFLLHLAGQVGATRRANKWEDVQCCGFEVDLRDGTGYFTRYL